MNSSLLITGTRNMQSKSLLIAIAAFAVTATGAQAFVGTNYLNQSGLSTQQVEAFTQARELRRKGEVEKARDLLLEAGVTEETLKSLHKASRDSHEAMHNAIKNGDYEAFRVATEGTPLYDIINSEEDFKLFIEAHELKKEGKKDEANEIFDDLGLPTPKMEGGKGMGKEMRRGIPHDDFLELSDEQRDALRVARQANDEETVAEILKEAGIAEDKIERIIEKRNWHHKD